MMKSDQKFCLVSSNYPPDIGGPSKFASTFPFSVPEHSGTVITTTFGESDTLNYLNHAVIRVSRNKHVVHRTVKVVWVIWKTARTKSTKVIANGFFIETFFACLFARRSYVVKLPGDIVWEKAKNANLTNLSIVEFQKANLQFKLRILRTLNSLSIRSARKVICPTKELGYLAKLWGVDDKKITVIPNSVDASRFLPEKNITKDIDVICVNRLVEWKGLHEVIEACSRLNLKLTIAGTGPMYEDLQKQALSLKAHVTFLGDVSNEDLIAYLNRSSIYILNSTYEATAYSLLEAMSCGLVSIARIGTGSEDVIDQNLNGLLVGGSDYPLVLDALSAIKDNHKMSAIMGISAREKITKEFDISMNYSRISKILFYET
jgi:glycosyltransferase involved in cell wall biosynthesis